MATLRRAASVVKKRTATKTKIQAPKIKRAFSAARKAGAKITPTQERKALHHEQKDIKDWEKGGMKAVKTMTRKRATRKAATSKKK